MQLIYLQDSDYNRILNHPQLISFTPLHQNILHLFWIRKRFEWTIDVAELVSVLKISFYLFRNSIAANPTERSLNCSDVLLSLWICTWYFVEGLRDSDLRGIGMFGRDHVLLKTYICLRMYICTYYLLQAVDLSRNYLNVARICHDINT